MASGGDRIDPFELFCAYHLGITEAGEARVQNIHQVARRFGVGPDEVRAALERHQMTPEQVLQSGFDPGEAQADLAVAPAGIDRRELARTEYARFREAQKGGGRDWERELAEDAAAVADDPLFRK